MGRPKGSTNKVPSSDHTDKRFDRLVVKEITGRTKNGHLRWLCLCDCGNSVEVLATNLVKGHTKSCGCISDEIRRSKRMDMIGEVFEYLTVKEFAYEKGDHKYWHCSCKCGNDIVVEGGNLRARGNSSCGCKQKENVWQSARNSVLASYKTNAQKRKLEWTLTDKECYELFESNCHYCGSKPSNKKRGRNNIIFVYSGIDRVKNNEGYTVSNSRSCCWACNRSKHSRSQEDFLDHARRLVYYQDKKRFDLLSLAPGLNSSQELSSYGN